MKSKLSLEIYQQAGKRHNSRQLRVQAGDKIKLRRHQMASISLRKIDDTRTLTAARIGMMIEENVTDTRNQNLHGTIIDLTG